MHLGVVELGLLEGLALLLEHAAVVALVLAHAGQLVGVPAVDTLDLLVRAALMVGQAALLGGHIAAARDRALQAHEGCGLRVRVQQHQLELAVDCSPAGW